MPPTSIGFDAITVVGGLLAPEWLTRVAQQAAERQTEADYGVPRGLSLRDEIARAWNLTKPHWRDQTAGAKAGKAEELSVTFVTRLLTLALGFDSLTPVAPIEHQGRVYPIGHAALEGRVPVVIAPLNLGLDSPSPLFGDGGRRRSAFGLCQEALNVTDGALWGLCSDGHTLRIVRDNGSLTRPAWIQVSLREIFEDERYADFTALWLLTHQTRFGRPGEPPADCPLERWREAGREAGTRARDRLRDGVEAALLTLGQGFIAHPHNEALRAALADGSLTAEALQRQLLRLLYQLIFALTVEERGLLHPDSADAEAKRLYAEAYSLSRLRERAARRAAHDHHHDAWEGLKITLRALNFGEPRLGLPALGGVFRPDQHESLDAARITNRDLLTAVFHLTWLKETTGIARVNWRDMGPEELGSVYESLLELVPSVSLRDRRYTKAEADESRGNARKTTGSYYTPDSLVATLLDTALEPVIQATAAAHPKAPAEALLRLTVVDPACGSGHFLLAAARRLAAHVARHRADGTPTAQDYQRAVRDVVGRCLYGVDLNPQAVELCQMALWLEAVVPGQPLSFLRGHIQRGNALLGATPELLAQGVPDAAFEPLTGDDRKVSASLKRRNKAERGGQATLTSLWGSPDDARALARGFAAVDAAPDTTPDALQRKEADYDALIQSPAWRSQRLIADAWCAAFLWPKHSPGALAESAPTDGLWRDLRDGRASPTQTLVDTVEALRDQHALFHWSLHFPQVFERGGFDVVLGNPPWERVKLQEQEFFASRSPEIAQAKNAAARKRLIAALPEDDPTLWTAWQTASREAEGQSHLLRASGRYPLCGKGDVNTYALFAEHNRALLAPRGRAGFIVPPGLATDDTTKAYFQELTQDASLISLYEFENEAFLFPGIDHRVRFIMMTIAGKDDVRHRADLSFGHRKVETLADSSRHVVLSPEDFLLLNPNTKTCPTFHSRRDGDINIAMYRRAGILWQEEPEYNPWDLRFMAMLHMANDSGLFKTFEDLRILGASERSGRLVFEQQEYLPLIEAKMIHQFNHRYGTYEGQTEAGANQGKLPELQDDALADPRMFSRARYYVEKSEINQRLQGRTDREWLLGWRDICRSTDQRTVIASLVPYSATGDTFLLAMSSRPAARVAMLYANLCSFVLDYAARQKVGGTHLKYHTFKQLPILPPDTYDRPCPWSPGERLEEWLLPRVLELTVTAWDLVPFAR
ncbi:N-6 DNA methylase, partial [Myxococcota bacterium]|nr:N-6 DNA methylase [Myxococcota bacterium]